MSKYKTPTGEWKDFTIQSEHRDTTTYNLLLELQGQIEELENVAAGLAALTEASV